MTDEEFKKRANPPVLDKTEQEIYNTIMEAMSESKFEGVVSHGNGIYSYNGCVFGEAYLSLLDRQLKEQVNKKITPYTGRADEHPHRHLPRNAILRHPDGIQNSEHLVSPR